MGGKYILSLNGCCSLPLSGENPACPTHANICDTSPLTTQTSDTQQPMNVAYPSFSTMIRAYPLLLGQNHGQTFLCKIYRLWCPHLNYPKITKTLWVWFVSYQQHMPLRVAAFQLFYSISLYF